MNTNEAEQDIIRSLQIGLDIADKNDWEMVRFSISKDIVRKYLSDKKESIENMSKYRAVMATTVDCEGCKYDSETECTADFCILLDKSTKAKYKIADMTEKDVVKKILNIVSDEVHEIAKQFRK